jgi:hypothetical protein
MAARAPQVLLDPTDSGARTKTVTGERRYSNTGQTPGATQALFISPLTFRAAGA